MFSKGKEKSIVKINKNKLSKDPTDIFDDLLTEETHNARSERVKFFFKIFMVFVISFSLTFYNYAALPVADTATHILLKTNIQIQKAMEQLSRNNWIEALKKYQTMIKHHIQQIRELQSIYQETKSHVIYMKNQIGEWKKIGLILKFNSKDILRDIEEYSDRVVRTASGEPVQTILADTGAIAERMEKNAIKLKTIINGKKGNTSPTFRDVRELTNQALGTPQLTNNSTMDILAQYSVEDTVVTMRKINQQLSNLIEEKDNIDKKYKDLANQGLMNESLKAEYDMKINHINFQMQILQTKANLMMTELNLISEMAKIRDRRNFEKAKMQERLSQQALMNLFGPNVFVKQVQ